MSHKIDLTGQIQKQINRFQVSVEESLIRIRPEKLSKYIVLCELYKGESTSLWILSVKVDQEAKDELQDQIGKIDKKLKVFERTIEFFESGSDAIDPRIAKLLKRLNKITEGESSYGKKDQLKLEEKIDGIQYELENTCASINACASINKETEEGITLAKEGLFAAKRILNQLELSNVNSNNCNKTIPLDDSWDEDYYSKPIELVECKPRSLAEYEPILALQKTVDALSLRSEDGFYVAIEQIGTLNSFPTLCLVGQAEPGTLGDRIFFQLYHIQNKETPNKIDRKDSLYGTNAFQCDLLSTPDERVRAAQRVQVELMLFILSDMHQNEYSNANDGIRQAFEILEKMELHANDMPYGVKNFAHALFGKMYNDYLAMWEKNNKEGWKDGPLLPHPHDKVFKGDFGRNAFYGNASTKIPDEFKRQVLQEFIKSIHQNWGI